MQHYLRSTLANDLPTTDRQLDLTTAEQKYSDLLINKLLDTFDPNYRYLRQIKFDGNKANATFCTNMPLPYTHLKMFGNERTAVLTAFEFLLSFNQLAMAQVAHVLTTGKVTMPKQMGLDEFNRAKGLLHNVGMEKVKIKRKINPEYYFATIEILQARCIGNTLYFKHHFSINDGCHAGIFNGVFDLNALPKEKT